jgi:Na+/melibiose symporter-like transporter
MQKFTKKSQIILYGCAGLGVNMLNMIVGTYLCSALLVGGFVDHVEQWTYLNKDLVVAALWSVLIVIAKAIDGIIDVPLSHFTDHLKTRWGKRRPAIVLGYVPMIIAYLLFLIPIEPSATVLNTIWFAFVLFVFYGAYTLTMLTYYATFAEVTRTEKELVLLSNVKSTCDVVYFSLSYALVPLFVSMGMNIRNVAIIFLPLSLTMLIPMFMLKEESTLESKSEKPDTERVSLKKSLFFVFMDKPFIFWMCCVFVMNMGLQLFLGGINEYFSTTGLNMTVVMATCFAPVPFTLILYNKIVNKKGLGFAYRYILLVFAAGMALMGLCRFIPASLIYPYAILCSLIASFSIGAFFSITYTVPSHRAALRVGESKTASSMYFAIQGLFEGVSAGIGTGVILVFLKQSAASLGFNLMPFMTVIVAALCMVAFAMSFRLPQTITKLGLSEAEIN